MAEEDSTRMRYAVYRLWWDRWESDTGEAWQAVNQRQLVGEFDSAEEAEECRRQVEAEQRAQANPFLFIGTAPYEQTSLPEGVLRDWLLDGGITPPPPGADSSGWQRWWDENAPAWSAESAERVWQVLDRVRFAEVEARPAATKVFAVLHVWQWYNDNWTSTSEHITTVFRTRERAEQERARLAAEADEQREQQRRAHEARVAAGEEDEPFEDDPQEYKVVELDAEGLA